MLIAADTVLALFDDLPDTVFFIKDQDGNYSHGNRTLLRRLGLRSLAGLVGRPASALFPGAPGVGYSEQDRRVLSGDNVHNQLEMHLYADGSSGWCLTSKRSLRVGGRICGVIGTSRDLHLPGRHDRGYRELASVLEHLRREFRQPLPFRELAALARLSLSQLERRFRQVFQLSPQQMLTRFRIEHALQQLAGDTAIADIAAACGYRNHSAFARQFKASVGLSPRQCRQLLASGGIALSVTVPERRRREG